MVKGKRPKCQYSGCNKDAEWRGSVTLPIDNKMASMLGKYLGGMDPRYFLTYRGLDRFVVLLCGDDLYQSNDAFRRLIKWEHLLD